MTSPLCKCPSRHRPSRQPLAGAIHVTAPSRHLLAGALHVTVNIQPYLSLPLWLKLSTTGGMMGSRGLNFATMEGLLAAQSSHIARISAELDWWHAHGCPGWALRTPPSSHADSMLKLDLLDAKVALLSQIVSPNVSALPSRFSPPSFPTCLHRC
jgi:hypothetical protein